MSLIDLAAYKVIKDGIDLLRQEAEFQNQPKIAVKCQHYISLLQSAHSNQSKETSIIVPIENEDQTITNEKNKPSQTDKEILNSSPNSKSGKKKSKNKKKKGKSNNVNSQGTDINEKKINTTTEIDNINSLETNPNSVTTLD
ncbi:hypothetical protein AYI70_g3689 [Smittium culicis]|uniref:Uncharacterized protein n=1 Tax=Smittium culicis TaxID=133412 RepID=A0A1R1Y289_9FUNG|nr:hypothetical protein AYI70_g3689 [Smittium culicis]